MNMAPLGTFFFITVLSTFFSVKEAQTFVNVDCKAENTGQYGKDTMLECVVHFRVTDANIVMVTWKKEGVDTPLLSYTEGNTSKDSGKESRYLFADKSWNSSNTNVSLLITNTEMTHAGKYKCTVITDRGLSTRSTNLKVTAKYNKPTIRKTDSSGENGYECHSDGGYPEGQLRWIVDKIPWQKSIETEVKESESGLYNLSSKLTLMKDSQFSEFTCVVFNASGEKENEATLIQLPDTQPRGPEQHRSPAEIVAPLVVIGSLIVGLLLVLFLRRRSRREPQVCRYEYDAEQGTDQETVDKCEEKPCLRE